MARRRKSRSESSRGTSAGTRWKRVILLGGLLLFVTVVLAGFGAFLAIKAYLRSDKFRGLVSAQTSTAFQADGEYERFSWTGATVYSDAFNGRGYEDAAFSRVKANGIEAEVSLRGVRRGVWDVVRVDIQQLNVLVDGERIRRDESAEEELADERAEAEPSSGLFSGIIPDKVEIRKTKVLNTNFDIQSGGEPAMKGRGIALEVTPTSTENVFKITGNEGSLEIAALPENLRRLSVGDFILRSSPDGVFVDNAALKFSGATPGSAHLTGVLGGGGATGNLDLRVVFEGVPADKVLPPDWAKKLGGRFGGEVEVTGDPKAAGGPRVAGRVVLADGVLEALPVLERIDSLAGTTKFRRLLFSVCAVEFEKTGSDLAITEFLLASAGTACVQGKLDYSETRVTGGRYLIGVAPDVIKWMPEWKRKIVEQVFRLDRDAAFGQVFSDDTEVSRPPEGYRWMVATVDPASADPFSADIRRQFVEAGGLAIWAELEGLSQQAIEVAEELAKTATDQGVQLLDVFTGERENLLFSEDGLLKLRQAGGGGLLELPDALIKGGLDTLNGLNPFGSGRR